MRVASTTATGSPIIVTESGGVLTITMPDWLQVIALALPTTHVFEGMRCSSRENGTLVQLGE